MDLNRKDPHPPSSPSSSEQPGSSDSELSDSLLESDNDVLDNNNISDSDESLSEEDHVNRPGAPQPPALSVDSRSRDSLMNQQQNDPPEKTPSSQPSEDGVVTPGCSFWSTDKSRALSRLRDPEDHLSPGLTGGTVRDSLLKRQREQAGLRSCSVCEKDLKDPVKLPCGHWSCKQCCSSGSPAGCSCKTCGKKIKRDPDHQTDTEEDPATSPALSEETPTEPDGGERREQELRALLLQKEIKRVEMETEKLRVEKERAQVEKERAQVEKEKLKAEKEKLQVEKEKLQVEKEKLQVEKEKSQVEKEKSQVEMKKILVEMKKLRVKMKELQVEMKRLWVEKEKLWVEMKKLWVEMKKILVEMKKLRVKMKKFWVEMKKFRVEMKKLWVEMKKMKIELEKTMLAFHMWLLQQRANSSVWDET